MYFTGIQLQAVVRFRIRIGISSETADAQEHLVPGVMAILTNCVHAESKGFTDYIQTSYFSTVWKTTITNLYLIRPINLLFGSCILDIHQ
jgi:hypothetical protein